MPNRRYNKQVANQMKSGGRVKRMGGGMSTRRRDMKSGYYPDDMGMKGGVEIKATDAMESQVVDVRGTRRMRPDKKPVKATWY